MKKYIIANWKMNKTVKEAVSFVKELQKKIKNKKADIGICAPYTSLYSLSKILIKSKIKLGAQNVFYEENGAFTGEISPLMLKELNCKYCIVGHSERRHIFNESDTVINNKIRILLKYKIAPILCVGETLEERKNNIKFRILENQVRRALNGVVELKDILIAYEPVWAIGTGENATPKQAEEAHLFIRDLIKKIYDMKIAKSLPILYGGSVNQENVRSLLKMKNIDGALVGGSSLNVESFAAIINSVR